MNAAKFLKQQHREVEELFAQIEKSEKNPQKCRTLFADLADKIENHAKIEEKVFYPEGRSADEDMTLEAYEEHAVVHALILKLRKTKPTDETFMAKITVLKEMIEHHVEEEEGEYFPRCERELGKERMEELGQELEEAYAKLTGKTKERLAA